MPRKRQDSSHNEESDSESSSEDSSDSSRSERSHPPQSSRDARHSRLQKAKSEKRGPTEKEDGELTEEEKQKMSSVKKVKEKNISDKDIDESEDHSQKVRPVLESDSEGEASEKSGVRSHMQSKVKMGSSVVSVVKLSESKDNRAATRLNEGRDGQRQDYRGDRGRDRRYDNRGRRYGGQSNRMDSEQGDRRHDLDFKYGRKDRDQSDRRRDRDDRTRDRQRDWQKDSTRDDRRRDLYDEKKDREEKKNKDDEKESEKGNKPGQDSSEPGAKGAAEAGKKMDDIMSRTGGAYIPPAKLRMMQEQITDKTSAAYQRMSWEALKKSINGLINKVNISNLINIVKEVFQENIVRGRGLLARSVIQAQAASPTFTHVYAALVAVINTKFPQNGELILRRLILMFRRGYRRNDKALCLSTTRFIAHLVNQQVAHEVLALEILTLLLETPTDDSVEVAIGFLKECGLKLTEVSPRGINSIFERLRNVLHEGQLDTRVQYMVEVMFAIRKDGFKDHPAVLPDLDLVEEEEQFTHLLQLEDAVAGDEMLNIFHEDPNFQENEDKYKALKKEILDEGSSDEESGGASDESGSTDSEEEEDEKEKAEAEKQAIIDKTETNLIALRRIIYLTVQSSLDVNECAHKMLKMELKPGQEVELCNMILDCCAQLRTYEKFFGLLGQRFCQIDKKYVEPFQQIFVDQYDTIHRLETNKLRNVAKFFAHLLFTDAISWGVLSVIKLTEDDTTSASRIFLKILFQELSEYMGLSNLNERLKDPTLSPFFSGIMPRDNPKNTRFSINFFTTIGLGGLTDELRDHLKVVTKQIVQQKNEEEEESSSSESSDSSSDSNSSSESEPEVKKKKTSKVSKSSEKKSEKLKKKPSNEKENRSRPSKKQVNGRLSSPQRGSKTIADRLLDMAQYGDLQNGDKTRSHKARDKEEKSLSNDREKRNQQKSRSLERGESKEHRDRSARSRKEDYRRERRNSERMRGGEERMSRGDSRKNNRERNRSSTEDERSVDRNKYNSRRHGIEEIVVKGSEDRRRRQEEYVRKNKTDSHSRDRDRNIETYKGKQSHDSPDDSEDDNTRHNRQVQSKAKKRQRSKDTEKKTKNKNRLNQKRKKSESSSESDDSSSSPASSSSSPSSSSSSSDEEEKRKAKKAKLKEHKGSEFRHGGQSREKARVENDRARRR